MPPFGNVGNTVIRWFYFCIHLYVYVYCIHSPFQYPAQGHHDFVTSSIRNQARKRMTKKSRNRFSSGGGKIEYWTNIFISQVIRRKNYRNVLIRFFFILFFLYNIWFICLILFWKFLHKMIRILLTLLFLLNNSARVIFPRWLFNKKKYNAMFLQFFLNKRSVQESVMDRIIDSEFVKI